MRSDDVVDRLTARARMGRARRASRWSLAAAVVRRWRHDGLTGGAIPRMLARFRGRHLRLRLWWDDDVVPVSRLDRPGEAIALRKAGVAEGPVPDHAPRASVRALRRAGMQAGSTRHGAPRTGVAGPAGTQSPLARAARGIGRHPARRTGALELRNGVPVAAARAGAATRQGHVLLRRLAEGEARIDAATPRATGLPGTLVSRLGLEGDDLGPRLPGGDSPSPARRVASPAHPRRALPATHAPAALAGDPAQGAARAGRALRASTVHGPAAAAAAPAPGAALATVMPASRAARAARAVPERRPLTPGDRAEPPPARPTAFLAHAHARDRMRTRPIARTPGPVPSRAAVPGGAGVPRAQRYPSPVRLEPSIGSPLPAELRARLEPRFGDLGGVRLHTGDAAGRAARALRAAAFTAGRHVFFAPGRYAPETEAGQELLVHELAHVRQQPGGRAFGALELTPAAQEALEHRAGAGHGAVPSPRIDGDRPLIWAPLSMTYAPPGVPSVPMLAPESTPLPAPAGAAAAAPATAPAGQATAGTTGAAASAPGAAAAAASPDVGELVDEVMRRLAQRRRLDAERGGIQPWL